MTKKVSGLRPALKLPTNADRELLVAPHGRRPHYVNRPAKATEEGYVTLGFRGTIEDDDLVREAVELAGYYSKAELVRMATMDLAQRIVSEHRKDGLVEAARKLGVSPSALAELLKSNKRTG